MLSHNNFFSQFTGNFFHDDGTDRSHQALWAPVLFGIMGVAGLHSFVKSIVQSGVSLSEFCGQTLAIDASAWLHRGLFVCPLDVLAGQPTDRFLDQPLKLIATFEKHGVRPLFVFDGAVLPMKSGDERRELRSKALEEGLELLRSGHESEATSKLAKAAKVQPWMAMRLIDELRHRGLPFVVAPYEADPQLAFLVREGHCAAAISEDSDLLPYGCPLTMYKLDLESGTGQLVKFDDLRSAEDDKGSHLFDGEWVGEWDAWRAGLFAELCVLSGTDYLKKQGGVGIKTAHKALRQHRSLARALRNPPLRTIIKLDDAELSAYQQDAERVRQVFRHALVFDVQNQTIVHLHALPPGERSPEHLGRMLAPDMARLVCAAASLDPMTLRPRTSFPAISEVSQHVVQARAEGAAAQQQRANAAAMAAAAAMDAPADSAPDVIMAFSESAAAESEAPWQTDAAAAAAAAKEAAVADSARDSAVGGTAEDLADLAALALLAGQASSMQSSESQPLWAPPAGAIPRAPCSQPLCSQPPCSQPLCSQPPCSQPGSASRPLAPSRQVAGRPAGESSSTEAPSSQLAVGSEVASTSTRSAVAPAAARVGSAASGVASSAHSAVPAAVPAVVPAAEPPTVPPAIATVNVKIATALTIIAESAAFSGSVALLMSPALLEGIEDVTCPETTRAWLLYALVSDMLGLNAELLAAPASAEAATANGAPTVSANAKGVPCASYSPACLKALRPALALLLWLRTECRRRESLLAAAQWPPSAHEALLAATVCCWRQALLQPLRAGPHDPLDWPRFVSLIPEVPAEALVVLAPELNDLIRPSGRLCGCASALLSRRDCRGGGNTCQEMRLRVTSYRVAHPPHELRAPLTELLRLMRPLMPLPRAVLAEVRQRAKAPHAGGGGARRKVVRSRAALEPPPPRRPRVEPPAGGRGAGAGRVRVLIERTAQLVPVNREAPWTPDG